MTRLMSCTEEELKTYRGLDLMPTFVAPSFKADPEHGDTYAAYNKPGAILAWLEVDAAAPLTLHLCPCSMLGIVLLKVGASVGKASVARTGTHGHCVVHAQEAEPPEEYILIVDADNIMRFPFDPLQMRVEPGAQQPPRELARSVISKRITAQK